MSEELADLIRESDPPAGFSREDCYLLYKAECKRNRDRRIEIATMFPGLVIRPLLPGSMTTIVATTGTSKTWLLMHMARYFNNFNICFFEMELTAEQLIERELAIENTMSPENVYINTVNKRSLRDFASHRDNLRIFDCARLTVEDMESRIGHAEGEIGKIDIVMIDYMGLISGHGARYEKATDNAQKIKRLAKNCQVAAISLSQIARKSDDKFRPVTLYDAKDSGDIENSSGLVIGMWPHRKHENTHRWIKVLKNNDFGSSGTAHLFEFNWRHSTFAKAAPLSEEPETKDWATLI